MKQVILVAITGIAIGAYFLFFSGNLIEKTIQAHSLNPAEFLSGQLVLSGKSAAQVSLQKINSLKTSLHLLANNSKNTKEKETFLALENLSDFYAKKIELNQKSEFFQKETDLKKLCARFAETQQLLELQEDLYRNSLELFVLSVELKEKYRQPAFSINPENEFNALQRFRQETKVFEFGCVIA